MKTQKPLNFIFIGRSGSGKGTQSKFLLDRFGDDLFYVSTGDLFRRLSKLNTDTSKHIKKILNEGGLPFDDLATTLWMYEIATNVKENQGVLFDGAPRRLQEAKNIDNFFDFLERKDRTLIFHIDISRGEAFDRLMARGRSDDTPDSINNRLDYFDEIVTDVLKYYQESGRLITINGERDIKDVTNEMIDYVNKFPQNE